MVTVAPTLAPATATPTTPSSGYSPRHARSSHNQPSHPGLGHHSAQLCRLPIDGSSSTASLAHNNGAVGMLSRDLQVEPRESGDVPVDAQPATLDLAETCARRWPRWPPDSARMIPSPAPLPRPSPLLSSRYESREQRRRHQQLPRHAKSSGGWKSHIHGG